MSFHRTLPPLPALSNQALRDRWAIQPDTLKSSRIMPDETADIVASENKSSAPAPRRFSFPPEEGVQRSPGEESLEDYESPKQRTHSLSQADRTGHRLSRADQSPVPRKSVVENWQENPPSSICLCQPDPKVPRPRNGMCTSFPACILMVDRLSQYLSTQLSLTRFLNISNIAFCSFHPLSSAPPTGRSRSISGFRKS